MASDVNSYLGGAVVRCSCEAQSQLCIVLIKLGETCASIGTILQTVHLNLSLDQPGFHYQSSGSGFGFMGFHDV